MKTLLVDRTNLWGGSRLDVAYNIEVWDNQRLATSPYPWVTLKELALDLSDGLRNVEPSASGVPYVRLGDLATGELAEEGLKRVDGTAIPERFRLRPGDILVSKTGEDVRAAVVSEEFDGALFSPDLYRIRLEPDCGISPTWVSAFMNTRFAARVFSDRSYGGAIKRVSKRDFVHIRIPVPSAEVLDEVQALDRQARESSREAESTFRAVRKSLYDEIDARTPSMAPASHPFGLFHRSWISARWDVGYVRGQALSRELARTGIVSPLRDLADVVVASRKHLDTEQEVQYVQVSDIDARYLAFARTHRSLVGDLPSRVRVPLQTGQVLVLASGSNLGTPDHPVAVVGPEMDGCLTTNAFIALEFAETPIYFGLVMKHPLVLAQLHGLASGSVIQMIGKKDIGSVWVPVLNQVWRQDYDDRARIAWERRRQAQDARRHSIRTVDHFIARTLKDLAQ